MFGGCFVDVWVLVDYMDVDEVCIDVGDDVDYVVCWCWFYVGYCFGCVFY